MSAHLRIVHVDNERGFSGGEGQVVGLVEGLRARGHECVVARPTGSELDARGRALGWTGRDLAIGGDADVRAVFALAELLRAERADVVHLHTGRAAWIGGWAAKRAGVPAIVTRRQDKRLRGWKHRQAYVRLPAATVGVSPAVTAQVRALGAEPGRSATIWDAVEPSALAPGAPRESLRAAHELPADTFVVGVLAALVRRKGLDVLLAALAHLRTEREVVALIAGDGPERAVLQAQARGLPPRRSARFLGRVERPGDVLGALDAFCLPSRAEGLGVAALEAMLSGLPVVATSVGGLVEAVGDTGLIVAPDDPLAIAEALDRIAGDAAWATDLGARARRRVHERFLFERQVERYERLYERVVSRDPAPAAGLDA